MPVKCLNNEYDAWQRPSFTVTLAVLFNPAQFESWGLTGQMITHLVIFITYWDEHNHFVRNRGNAVGESSLIMTYDGFIFYFLSFKLVFYSPLHNIKTIPTSGKF